MNRLTGPIVVRVAIALVAVAFGAIVVWKVFGCTPPRDQTDMIERYKADPFFGGAPENGRLVEETSRTNACDAAHDGGSPLGPSFASVTRVYKTLATYTIDQLRQRFDQPAAVGGWRNYRAEAFDWGAIVSYCKQTGTRAAYASAYSADQTVTAADREAVTIGPGVEVSIGGGGDGTTCATVPGGG
jgi:hypothetical protein